MFNGLEHTAIASADPERLAGWYVKHLGFRINFSYDGNFFVKAPNGSILEIIPSEGERTPQGPKSPGIRHLAIAVDDFDGAAAALESSGVELGGRLQIKGNRLIFFTDCDGNLIHLIHREQPLP
jgi:glyoxylase I family protein